MVRNKEYRKTYEKYVPYKKLNEENFDFLNPEDNQPEPEPIPIVQTNKKMILDEINRVHGKERPWNRESTLSSCFEDIRDLPEGFIEAYLKKG